MKKLIPKFPLELVLHSFVVSITGLAFAYGAFLFSSNLLLKSFNWSLGFATLCALMLAILEMVNFYKLSRNRRTSKHTRWLLTAITMLMLASAFFVAIQPLKIVATTQALDFKQLAELQLKTRPHYYSRLTTAERAIEEAEDELFDLHAERHQLLFQLESIALTGRGAIYEEHVQRVKLLDAQIDGAATKIQVAQQHLDEIQHGIEREASRISATIPGRLELMMRQFSSSSSNILVMFVTAMVYLVISALPWMLYSTRHPAQLNSHINHSPKIDYIDPEPRYSDATVAHGLIFLGGQVPEDASADIQAQTRSVLAQIDALLERCGSDKAHILEAIIYLADIAADYDGMNEVWDAWTAPGRAPARACIEAKLAHPGWKVEIKLTAIRKPA